MSYSENPSMKGIIMNATLIQEMFKEYDSLTVEIARIEALASSLTVYPSTVISDLTGLHLQKWNVRRRINSAFTELEQEKPLWKRIFKK